MSIGRYWPLFDLRVVTPRLELRAPSDEDIAQIADRSVSDGIHDPAMMPFTIEWTDVAPPRLQREILQYHWGLRARWRPEEWDINMVVCEGGRIVGCQSLGAKNFATLRTGTTGSFLFLPEQGRGIGTEMRSAILHLLFDGLGAERAETAAWSDNSQSLSVTRKLGYEPTGSEWRVSRGAPRKELRFRLSREAWLARRREDITIEGLDACRELFGLTATVARSGHCAGVDGCNGGWVVASRAGATIEPAISTVIEHGYDAVAIDMPIGMPTTTARRSEIEARRYLSPRGSTIFPTPVRACLDATDYLDACAISFAARGVKLSKQSFAILPKIAEVDRALSFAHTGRVAEAHPECSFVAMNNEGPLTSKHSAEGIAQRRALVLQHFGVEVAALRMHGLSATVDDVLDAYAMLWTAERFAAGAHQTFPSDGDEFDDRGLPMRIVR